MKETTIDLIRHGEPVGGRAYRGHNIDDPLSDKGWQQIANDDKGIRAGLNVVNGKVTYAGVAEAFGIDYTPVEEIL